MNARSKTTDSYRGFEQGPIRPPSESRSLLVRVTRNCPWNRCLFCPVYKNTKFSLRAVSHVKRDIDCVRKHIEVLRRSADDSGRVSRSSARAVAEKIPGEDLEAFRAAAHWLFTGRMKHVFLQDADALVARPPDLVEILTYLKSRFPSVERITSYSRARTIAARKETDLRALADAGLSRIHVGLESGSDRVLERMCKGVTKKKHIEAGLKVKAARIELSEYVMPGLGGTELSELHAQETADALNRIDPDFIRFRTLAVPPNVPLFEQCEAGRFEKCTDLAIVREMLLLIERLDGISSVITSDHVLNLFGDLEGKLPDDKNQMTGMLRAFLSMDAERQRLYQVGRRLGIFHSIRDMDDEYAMSQVRKACDALGVTAENADQITQKLMTRYL